MPGEIILKGGKLYMVALWETHPYALEMQVCLPKLLAHFGNPELLGEIPVISNLGMREFRPKVKPECKPGEDRPAVVFEKRQTLLDGMPRL